MTWIDKLRDRLNVTSNVATILTFIIFAIVSWTSIQTTLNSIIVLLPDESSIATIAIFLIYILITAISIYFAKILSKLVEQRESSEKRMRSQLNEHMMDIAIQRIIIQHLSIKAPHKGAEIGLVKLRAKIMDSRLSAETQDNYLKRIAQYEKEMQNGEHAADK